MTRNNRRFWRLIATGLLLVPVAGPAAAAIFAVDTTLDAVDAAPGDGVCATAAGDCALRAAVQETNALAGADTILLPAGTYTLSVAGQGEDAAATGDLDVEGDLAIVGEGAPVTIIDAQGIDRVLDLSPVVFHPRDQVELRQLSLTGGDLPTPAHGTGLRAGPVSLTLDGVRVFENAGATAVDIWDSWVAVTHSRVEDNDATGFRTDSVNLDLSHTAIARNRGTGLQIAGPSANVTLQHCEIRDNDASDPEFPRIGGLSIGDTNRVWVLDCVIADNRGDFAGGLAVWPDSDVTLERTRVTGNHGPEAGGLYGSTERPMFIRDSTFDDNHSTLGVGGLNLGFEGSYRVSNATISGNVGATAGGVFAVSDGSQTQVSLHNTSIVDNHGGTAGGLQAADPLGIPVELELHHTLIANNTAATSPDCRLLAADIESLGFNLIGNDADCSFPAVANDQVGTPGSPIAPKLGPLTDNGGPTPTHLPQTGSPAIDAGEAGLTLCLATDQRGVARPNGAACDVGAVEAAPQCSDGIDNDGDGAIDFPEDADCRSATWRNERPRGCGLGFEVGALALLRLLRRRRRNARR
ncbi:MAG: hypothetical protein MJE66_20770 [Proteobacteria bacterium]|nr:hypothetical protein [Pseudomonadota bacterium]